MPWLPEIFNEHTQKVRQEDLRGGEHLVRMLKIGRYPTPFGHHAMNTEIGVVEKGANKWGRGYGMVELNPRDDFVDRQGNVRVIAPNQSRMPRGRFAAQGAALCNVGRNVRYNLFDDT